jgi:divalent metal cation (Fe/Co/Zn/Cd) transporter
VSTRGADQGVRFGEVELPRDLVSTYRKARRIEILTIVYLGSTVLLMYLVMGQSRAMRAAWIEDCLSFLPPLAFLVAGSIRRRQPDVVYPFGYHRAVSVAYVVAAVALLGMGSYIVVDAVLKVVAAERPPLGTVIVAGEQFWLGWLMLPVLLYSAIGPVLLGRAKLPLAAALHDKVLFADADMNKADWMTAVAAMVGVVGIGVGLWWLDGAAALVIGASVLHDGMRNTRAALGDLMDSRLSPFDSPGRPHPLVEQSHQALLALAWVDDAQVRLRELGHVVQAEAFVVPRAGEEPTVARLQDAAHALRHLSWKLHDVVVTATAELPVGNVDLPRH